MGSTWAMAERQQCPPWKGKLIKPQGQGVKVPKGWWASVYHHHFLPGSLQGGRELRIFPKSPCTSYKAAPISLPGALTCQDRPQVGPKLCKPSQPQIKVQTLHSSMGSSPLTIPAGWPCVPILLQTCDIDSYPNTALLPSYRSQAMAPTVTLLHSSSSGCGPPVPTRHSQAHTPFPWGPSLGLQEELVLGC